MSDLLFSVNVKAAPSKNRDNGDNQCQDRTLIQRRQVVQPGVIIVAIGWGEYRRYEERIQHFWTDPTESTIQYKRACRLKQDVYPFKK